MEHEHSQHEHSTREHKHAHKKHWSHDVKSVLLSKYGMIGIAAIAGLIVLRLGLNFLMRKHHKKFVPNVNIVQPLIRSVESTMTLPANIEAIEEASIFSHVAGYLKKIYVDEGDVVKKNELLATIDAPDIVDAYNNTKAEYLYQKVTRDRYQQLVQQQVISQQEFDTVDAKYNEAKALYEAAAANLAYTYIRAPFSGNIARRYKYPGDLITVGKGQLHPIFLEVNESTLRISINVPQTNISNVRIGELVDIQVDAFPHDTFKGKISRIDDQLDPTTKTQRILVDIPNPDNKLHAGMFANIILRFAHKDNAITLPQDVVETEGKKNFVFVFSDGKAHKVEVQTGIRDSSVVEITGGINPTDQVISTQSAQLVDGMEVKPIFSTPNPG